MGLARPFAGAGQGGESMSSNLDLTRRGGFARLLGAASLAAVALTLATPAAAQTVAPADPAVPAPAAGPATPSADTSSAQQPDATATAAAPPVEDTSIVITGFRSSLARAINMKRNENASTDSILAEDIGK